uniref:Chitobiosyldiphosphodolichol beta-mannosyltransferase-like n=1 Tax=Gouania willdenowi TaxID=441366 RepID=A0A8C5GGL9_GOUWI
MAAPLLLVTLSAALSLTVSLLVAGCDPVSVVPVPVLTGLLLLLFWILRRRSGGSERRVCVLVLGDVGRSPRMQYHALSLSRHRYRVTVVGFLDSKPHPSLLNNERITIVPISEVRGVQGGPKLLTYVTKVVLQSLTLFTANPPGLPAMAVVKFVCFLRRSSFILDWHNYGYTIMALSHGPTHTLVWLAERYERFFGPLADRNLCVTAAMADDLRRNWGVQATTLYDRPASIFRETPLELQHQLFLRLADSYPEFRPQRSSGLKVEHTAFTIRDDDGVKLIPERPALLMSSTSWTGQNHFINEPLKEQNTQCVRLCVPGKGPLKDHYRRIISSMSLDHVKICTPWMEAEDYPLLLGSADVGVSLHRSSSGLDLPMKVVDMFGCCLPVCALSFQCLSELVKHEENGLIFRDAQQLTEQLQSLLSDFPTSESKLRSFRRNLRSSRGQSSWDQNWDHNVLPLLKNTTC